MKVLYYGKNGGITGEQINESHFTRTAASVTDGEAVIKRRIYFQAETCDEDAVDILSLKEFPQKFSAHPRHPAFKYYGNANIQPISEKSSIWVAELDYSTTNPNAQDIEPWKLGPEQISLNTTEVTVPFQTSYDPSNSQKNKRVCNSAGDPFVEQKTARNLELSFTFAAKKWNEKNVLDFTNTINSKTITVAGYKIEAKTAIIKNLSPTFITVYEENSKEVKWKYWQIAVTILIDTTNTVIARKILDVGDRAKFSEFELVDDFLPTRITIPETAYPSQICRFRKAKNIAENGEPANYAPIGDLVFCSWDQFLTIAKHYQNAALQLGKTNLSARNYQPQVEQMSQMPLFYGHLDLDAIKGEKQYETLTFYEYPTKSWSSLDLPEKGM